MAKTKLPYENASSGDRVEFDAGAAIVKALLSVPSDARARVLITAVSLAQAQGYFLPNAAQYPTAEALTALTTGRGAETLTTAGGERHNRR